MYGLIKEQQDDVISKNISDPRLQQIYRDLESELNVKFEQRHFDKAKKLDGDIKQEAGGVLPEALEAFKKLQNVCPELTFYNDDPTGVGGYRTYEESKNQFKIYFKRRGNTIDGGMLQAALPGFSQHHTGRAIDIGEERDCAAKNCEQFGFIRPFMTFNPDTERINEPWHLYYVGTNQQQPNQGQEQNNTISITSSSLEDFGNEIAIKTSGQSLDLSSIKLDVDGKTFSVNRGNTKVFKLVLRWNMPNETICESCNRTVSRNTEYGAKELIGGKFENKTRIYSLIVLYPELSGNF